MLVSLEGEAWTATWPAAAQLPQQVIRRAVSPPAALKGGAATTAGAAAATISLKLKRISHAHRAVAAACDQKGTDSIPPCWLISVRLFQIYVLLGVKIWFLKSKFKNLSMTVT